MKFEYLDISDDKDLVIMKRKEIWKILQEAHEANMKKFHSSWVPRAAYEAMETRCIVHSNKTEDLIIKSVFKQMLTEYKTGKVDWPGGFSAKEFNLITHMFVKGQISEC